VKPLPVRQLILELAYSLCHVDPQQWLLYKRGIELKAVLVTTSRGMFVHNYA
jgi:hypothetical protein